MPHSPTGFTVRLQVPLPPAVVWARLWDLDRHSRFIPFTAVTPRRIALGSRFVARTTVGPVGFDDVMVVRTWEPPHRAVVVKTGRWLRGTIDARLAPRPGGTELTWHQRVHVPGLPAALLRAFSPLLRRGYAASLRRILTADDLD